MLESLGFAARPCEPCKKMTSAGGHGPPCSRETAPGGRSAQLLIPVRASTPSSITSEASYLLNGDFLAAWCMRSLSLAAFSSGSRKGKSSGAAMQAQSKSLCFDFQAMLEPASHQINKAAQISFLPTLSASPDDR